MFNLFWARTALGLVFLNVRLQDAIKRRFNCVWRGSKSKAGIPLSTLDLAKPTATDQCSVCDGAGKNDGG